MPKKKVEVYEKDQLIYPFIESDHVTFSNGMKVSEMLDQSISMPTVAHEDLSFKVGVGDQDVSSAIVDSSVAEMTIKGKTYQNILPEPSTHVLTNNKEMFKVNEGLDPNVEIVDGVSKSAILKGQTLVNCLKSKSGNYSEYQIYAIYDYDLLKPNTVYTFVNKWNKGGTLAICDDKGVITSINFMKNSSLLFTTPSTITNVEIYSVNMTHGGIQADCEKWKSSFMIIEGDHTEEDIPFFEGMQSVEVPSVTTIGKNLFDGEYELDKYLKADGTTSSSVNWATIKNYIRVKPNTTYTQNIRMNSPVVYVVFYDKNKNIISAEVGTSVTYTYNSATYTTPNNCYYIKTCYDYSSVGNHLFQVEEGSTVTSYEPYKSSVFTISGTNLIIDSEKGRYYHHSQGIVDISGSTRYDSYRADVEGLTSVYVKNGHSNYTFWDANMNFISGVPYVNELTSDGSHNKDGIVNVPSNAKYMRFAYDTIENNGLPCVSEVVVLRKVGDAQDTLDLMTGELTQRIGEIVLDGSEDEGWFIVVEKDNLKTFRKTHTFSSNIGNEEIPNFVCDKLKLTTSLKVWAGYGIIPDNPIELSRGAYAVDGFDIIVDCSRMTSINNLDAFRQYLSQNPVTVQYELVTESIKTVDLSSSGNWEKVVLDGSTTGFYKQAGGTNRTKTSLFVKSGGVTNARGDATGDKGFNDSGLKYCNAWMMDEEGIQIENGKDLRLSLNKDKLPTDDENGLKQYLSQNPITIWYQTDTQKDTTQVKEPIFCKNGYIIQSSGAENSLIPTLDYQAKTSNSYVMDLMKANTIYTMKNDSANGKFTIDGTQYNLVTNGKLKTPTTLTDKLLVINGSASNTMILEGDLTSKTIPYFKGIKSAFEDESKIEVLSAGKNLFDGAFEKGMIDVNGVLGYVPTAIRTVNYINVKPNTSYHINLLNLEPFESFRVIYVHEYDENFKVLGETEVGNRNTYTSKSATKFIKINTHTAHDLPVDSKMIVCENSTLDKQYEPYKSNSTKIPLLSPLHSLPNGVYDEIILDRENNKAKVIQRVGVGVLDGTQYISMVDSSVDTSLYQPFFYGDVFGNMAVVSRDVVVVRCDKLLANSQTPPYRELTFNAIYQYTDSSARLAGQITKKDLGVKSVNDWFRANPTTIYYQLATPVITEVDLEGFPYIYKDGHIFLNSEIAPTTEITYSINQCQQISASNEDIIRHEKELTYLQKLIAQYVQVDYKSVLLSLKV